MNKTKLGSKTAKGGFANEKKEISVTKEELGNDWNKADNFIKTFKDLFTKFKIFSNWITNVSFALLGFYIALLLQIKSKITISDKTTITLISVNIVIPIAIGFYLRVKYEIIDWYIAIRDGVKDLMRFLNKASDKLEEKGAGKIERVSFNIKLEKLERWRKDIPLGIIICQILFFLFALCNVVIYLFRYLFSD